MKPLTKMLFCSLALFLIATAAQAECSCESRTTPLSVTLDPFQVPTSPVLYSSDPYVR